MLNNPAPIVRQQSDRFEREVEGLIEVCKYLSTASDAEKGILQFMQFDEHVVIEARRRVLKKSLK